MGRGDSLSGCCAFCLCPVAVTVTPEKNKHDAARKLILEKFYTEFLNNPLFHHLKIKKNGEKDEPADNWTICGECSPHVSKALGSKAKVDRVETEVRRLQRKVVEEMRGLLEEMDGMCGDMVMIEGILSNRDVNSDAASGRGMRGKCRDFKDKIINILGDLRNFQLEVGHKLVSSEMPRVKVKKYNQVTTIKSSKSTKSKNSAIRIQPQKLKNVPVPMTIAKPKIDDELKMEVIEEPADAGQVEEDDGDSWHWSGDGDNDDGPQSPVQNSSEAELIPAAKVASQPAASRFGKKRKRTTHLYHSKKKKHTTTTPSPEPKTATSKVVEVKAPALYPEDNDDRGDGHPESPGPHDKNSAPEAKPISTDQDEVVEDQEIPAKRPRRSRIPSNPDNKKEEDDFSFSSDSISEQDSSSDEYAPEDLDYKDVPVNKFRKNLISRIRLRNTISTSGCLPADSSDPRRPYRFHYNSTTNKFFVNDLQVDCLDFLEENADEPGLGCTQCDYAIYPSSMRHPRDNIEDYIFEHILGKHFEIYNCQTCGKSCHNFNKWREHHKTHVDAEAFSCDVCGRPMATLAALKFHRWTHFSKEEKEDPVNEHWMPLWVKKPNVERKFVCETCGKGFKRNSSLKMHEEVHKNEEEREKVICERCGSTVIALYYDIHKRKHCREPRDLRCHICGDGVKNVRELNKHLVSMHKDERSYECEVCGSRFTTMQLLRHHKEIHEEGEKYLCKGCGRGFKQRLSWWRHERGCGSGKGERREKRGKGGSKVKEELGLGGGERVPEEEACCSYQQAVWNP